MGIEIIPIGGYNEIGRNCTAVRIDDEVVILDMGLHMEKYIEYTDSDDVVDMSPRTLMNIGAVPDVRTINDLKKNVVAICISHAHLDHIGATPFLASQFKCPVYGTPFTMEVLKTTLKDEKINIPNKLKSQEVNSRFKISDSLEAEFINVTHSTPHTVMIAIHSKYGTVLYANDYKIDKNPTLGQKTNMKRLQKMEVKALIVDCLYSTNPTRTPSELVAKQMLKDILIDSNTKGKSVFVTTFSSHIARLKTIKEIGRKMGRDVVFLGRSLSKYVFSAENAKVTKFDDVEIVKYGNKVRRYLKKVHDPEKYLFVITGHQGEPKATLSRITYEDLFNFKSGDMVVFSCQIIPVPVNHENRQNLENALKKKGVRIFRDIHVSGHASLEDQRDVFGIIRPEHIIPVHGDLPRMEAMKKMALEEGYPEDKIHMLKNRDHLSL